MEIKWLGHSSFLITDSNGRTLLTDPFDESLGYETYKGKADVVTVSHQHFDHNYTESIQGNPDIVDKVGFFNCCDIPINGIPSYHDSFLGAKRGPNIIFVFEMDGYRICHLGDLGHPLTEDYVDKIGKVDVLMVPVGGNFTIDGKEAAEVCNLIGSHIVLPMHYKTLKLNFPIDGVEKFLGIMKNGETLSNDTLKLTADLKDINKVYILSPNL